MAPWRLRIPRGGRKKDAALPGKPVAPIVTTAPPSEASTAELQSPSQVPAPSELQAFLSECLDPRILGKVMNALEDEEDAS